MSGVSDFPYQVVTFLDSEPQRGEAVYGGAKGWYPQVAIKRRFALVNMSEETAIEQLREHFETIGGFVITTGGLVQPESMPVRIVEITNQDALKAIHEKLLSTFAGNIVSKFPDREGKNYLPHITAEYSGKFVIPVDEYTHQTFSPANIWLLKDNDSEDSTAYCKLR